MSTSLKQAGRTLRSFTLGVVTIALGVGLMAMFFDVAEDPLPRCQHNVMQMGQCSGHPTIDPVGH